MRAVTSAPESAATMMMLEAVVRRAGKGRRDMEKVYIQFVYILFLHLPDNNQSFPYLPRLISLSHDSRPATRAAKDRVKPKWRCPWSNIAPARPIRLRPSIIIGRPCPFCCSPLDSTITSHHRHQQLACLPNRSTTSPAGSAPDKPLTTRQQPEPVSPSQPSNTRADEHSASRVSPPSNQNRQVRTATPSPSPMPP